MPMEQMDLWPGIRATRTSTYPAERAQVSQPPFPGSQSDDDALIHWLSGALGKPVELTWTENRSTMLSFRHRGDVLALRLHRMFAQAGRAEMLALVRYLGGGSKRTNRILDDFIAAQARLYATTRVGDLRPKGRVYDLDEIFTELNAQYFHTGCTASITWSTQKPRKARRSIQLGCYTQDQNLIRLHPCLDQEWVPRFYVSGVVFHEMLHEVFGIGRHDGRRVVHPPEFMAVEESHPEFQRCKAWEEENIGRLLRYKPPADFMDD